MALDVLPEGFVERGVQGGRQGALWGEIPQEFLQHHLVQLPGLAGKLGIIRKRSFIIPEFPLRCFLCDEDGESREKSRNALLVISRLP